MLHLIHSIKIIGLVLFVSVSLLNNTAAQDLEVDGQVIINNIDTVVSAPDKVVRLENGALAIEKVSVGDTAFGGIVFYVDPSGKHGLVADFVDLANGVSWADTFINLGITSDAIYKGNLHTSIILASHRTKQTAARICYESTNNGYSDWFLPSFDELALMNENLHFNGLGNFVEDAFYWSSTEFSANLIFVKAVQFGALGAHGFTKSIATLSVRSVRRF